LYNNLFIYIYIFDSSFSGMGQIVKMNVWAKDPTFSFSSSLVVTLHRKTNLREGKAHT
jgi:hypothetical protein